jgi:hypothetical protein
MAPSAGKAEVGRVGPRREGGGLNHDSSGTVDRSAVPERAFIVTLGPALCTIDLAGPGLAHAWAVRRRGIYPRGRKEKPPGGRKHLFSTGTLKGGAG